MTTPDTTTPAVQPIIQHSRNGIMVRDPKTGRLMKGTKPANTITPENSRTLALERQKQKRDIIAQAANAAVERGDLRIQFGDAAWIAEIAANMQAKATTLDDPKSVDAARFLLQETGLAEARQVEQGQAGGLGDLLAAVPPGGLVMLVRQLRADPEQAEQSGDTIDAQSRDDDTPTP